MRLYIICLLFCLSLNLSAQQNIGVNTTTPEVTFDVHGSIQMDSALIIKPGVAVPAASNITFPASQSAVVVSAVSGIQTNNLSINGTPMNGQLLYITNLDDDPAFFGGIEIPSGRTLGFLYITASWHVLSTEQNNTDDQTLSLVDDSLYIADGNAVDFSPYRDNTDHQELSFNDPNLTISGGNSVDLSSLSANDADWNLNGNVLHSAPDSTLQVRPDRVSIGTEAPLGTFHVLNPLPFTGEQGGDSTNSIVLHTSVSNDSGAHYGAITWASSQRKRAAISTVMEHIDSDHVGLAFWTRGTDGPGPMYESMRLSYVGNLGVGTETPKRRVDVDGSIRSTMNAILTLYVNPVITEFSFAGSQIFELALNGATTGMKAVLADVFVTVDANDHNNIVLGDGAVQAKNWVQTRGQQPSSQFGSVANRTITLTYPGEVDGFTPNYGTWYSSQVIPLKTNGNIDFSNYSNSNSNGWVYIRVRGFYE